MTTFQKAVSETKALYEEAKRLHGDELNAAFNENKKEFWADVHKWDLETLIERSVSDAEIFDILVRSISKKLEEQKLLCALTRDWLVKFLRGEVKRPKEIAGRKDTFGRDSFIVYAIQRLKNQGMPVSLLVEGFCLLGSCFKCNHLNSPRKKCPHAFIKDSRSLTISVRR